MTIAHQDDIYFEKYAEKAVFMLENSQRPLIFFSNYGEIRAGRLVEKSKLLCIKRI